MRLDMLQASSDLPRELLDFRVEALLLRRARDLRGYRVTGCSSTWRAAELREKFSLDPRSRAQAVIIRYNILSVGRSRIRTYDFHRVKVALYR